MNGKAIARTMMALIAVIIILVAGLIGVVAYYVYLAPPPAPTGKVAVVTGIVKEKLTDLPVSFATVSAGGYSAQTGADGNYTLVVPVRTENYTLTVSKSGYVTASKSLAATEETTYTVNFDLWTPTPAYVTQKKFVLEGIAAFEWLDPHVSYYMWDYFIIWHSVETLLWYNGSSPTQIIPWLALNYTDISGNGTRYEWHLRQGIKFHDGTPFNATAVWFSMNRLLVMDGTSGDPTEPVHGSQAAWIIQQLLNKSLSSYFNPSGENAPEFYSPEWVQAVLNQNFIELDPTNPYKFYMNVQNPTTQFRYLFAMSWAGIVSPSSVIKKDYEYHGWNYTAEQNPINYTKYFEHMAGVGDTAFNIPEQGWRIGTGPYILESVDPTTYNFVLVGNPEYWGGPPDFEYRMSPGMPKIERIEYIYQPALATRLLDLRANTVSGIAVAPLDIFSVVDRDAWLNEQKMVSLIPGVTAHGPLPIDPVTVWFNFCTNVTDPGTGQLKKFQPMADWRIRMAIACAVNMTDMNINVNNRLGIEAQNLVPPNTFPDGTYNPNIKPAYSYNLTKAEELLVDAWLHPLRSDSVQMYYYNGTPIPMDADPPIVDNTFNVNNPKTIEMYVPAGATHYERVLTTIAENLNRIATRTYNTTTGKRDLNGEQLGITFVVVPVPGGQQYTLASRHEIYMYWGGWHADYNHILNWLGPMYLSSGTYFSWNLWNVTRLDEIYFEAIEADKIGNMTRLVELSNEANQIANEMVLYLWLWHPMPYYIRTSWLKNWYYNPSLGAEYIAAMYYETPP